MNGTLSTTRLSSKGQVVIPEEIRRSLGLAPGSRFVVLSEGDVVILKRIDAPARSEVRPRAREQRGALRKRTDEGPFETFAAAMKCGIDTNVPFQRSSSRGVPAKSAPGAKALRHRPTVDILSEYFASLPA